VSKVSRRSTVLRGDQGKEGEKRDSTRGVSRVNRVRSARRRVG
jgi:hypothetical protein